MKCNFSGSTKREDPFIYLENHEISQKRYFKYLSSIMDANGDIDVDVTHKIAVGWLKWRVTSGFCVINRSRLS